LNTILSCAKDQRWIHTLDQWPAVCGGCTQRGPHRPDVPGSGFNLGLIPGSDRDAVARHRSLALADLGMAGWPTIRAEQVHGTNVGVVRPISRHAPSGSGAEITIPGVDALMTDEIGLALMLVFADCCPVIVYSREPRCIAIAHCGWRGTVGNLIGATVSAMEREYRVVPAMLEGVVGPCICGNCYEVGPEVAAAARTIGGDVAVMERGAATYLDLRRLNQHLLVGAGLPAGNIRTIPDCTLCGPTPLYSWRRDGPATGRMAAMVGLAETK
jgi:polyphenol oxidase